MARSFKEVAHLRTDLEKYSENYDRIFGKHTASSGEAPYLSDETPEGPMAQESDKLSEHDESMMITNLARTTYTELADCMDTEGFPEASSFIYGFMKGYEKAEEAYKGARSHKGE